MPTYAFEVQVGGDVYHALGKLKHARDIWNSRVFFVASADDQARARQLLLGTFHELQSELHQIETERVLHLHKSKVDIFQIERELGIIP